MAKTVLLADTMQLLLRVKALHSMSYEKQYLDQRSIYMSQSILIAGCGYVGTALALELSKRGNTVWGLSRSVGNVSEKSFEHITADLTKSSTLQNLPKVDWVIVSVAPEKSDTKSYRKTYVEGVGNLIRTGLAKRILYISSTSVYGQKSGEWVDENSPTEPDHQTGKILLEAEKQILRSRIPSIVFRLGGIYGSDRNRIAFLKNGPVEMDRPDDYINLIHLDDIVTGVILLLEKGKTGEVYLGVDDKPVKRREYFTEISEMMEASAPSFKTGEDESFLTGRSNKQCRNQKLKSLGYEFKYSTFREGYRELIS